MDHRVPAPPGNFSIHFEDDSLQTDDHVELIVAASQPQVFEIPGIGSCSLFVADDNTSSKLQSQSETQSLTESNDNVPATVIVADTPELETQSVVTLSLIHI